MFYQLTGELIISDLTFAVIDCGGVGYKLSVSANTSAAITSKLGERVRLFTHLSVREDALELFGFWGEDELSAFRSLISVSGVGAKSAISILSIMTPDALASAVASGDARAISRAQGIGAKGAARIILELKDKLLGGVAAPNGMPSQTVGLSNRLADACEALIFLGYTRRDATEALSGIDPTLDVDEIVRAALKKLAK